MEVALFLGAGASKVFDKPTTTEFKEILLSEVSPNKQSTPRDTSLYLLLSHPHHPDIEYVFECIKNFRKFSGTQAYEFLESSPSYLQDRNGVAVELSNFFAHINNNYDFLEQRLFEYYSWKSIYDDKLRSVYQNIFKLLTSLSSKSETNIFTTNYDSAIENLCENNNYLLIDGFKFDRQSKYLKWDPTVFDDITENEDQINRIKLYKLHGSLTWKVHKHHNIIKTPGIEFSNKNDLIIDNALIAPTMSPKNDEEVEPFATLMQRFENQMKSTDVCIMIGFSFRDEEISKIFKNYIEGGRILVIISPSAIEDIRKSKILAVFLQDQVDKDDFVLFGEKYNLVIHQKELTESVGELLSSIDNSIKTVKGK